METLDFQPQGSKLMFLWKPSLHITMIIDNNIKFQMLLLVYDNIFWVSDFRDKKD